MEENQKDHGPIPDDSVEPADDAEDIPSDFFDDFSKEDFMEGLSVIDSWDDDAQGGKNERSSRGKRINAKEVENVKDLRELIGDTKDPDRERRSMKYDQYKWDKRDAEAKRSTSKSRLDDFVKPGSRRDPNKTNEAIKKDKEEKVKEMLAKQLESADDLRPPGTELDDFFNEDKPKETKKMPVVQEDEREIPPKYCPPKRYRQSPGRYRSPRRSPRRSPDLPVWKTRPRRSPYRPQWHSSPPHKQYKRQYSPYRRSPRRYSPARRSPRRPRYSRSPKRSYMSRRSRTRSRSRSPRVRDNFLYPKPESSPLSYSGPPGPALYQPDPMQLYAQPPAEYSAPGYSYSQVSAYNAGYPVPYDYGAQMTAPGPVPTPTLDPAPSMVPPPAGAAPLAVSLAPAPQPALVPETKTPYDALAQLVAEGKISKEDYLKLAPNKGISSAMDTKSRVTVLTECGNALNKLSKLFLPNRLMINNSMRGPEPKCIGPKYSSPLKRQAAVEFHFTKADGTTTAQQDKQLVDSILSTLELDKVVSRSKKKPSRDMKDAAVQTTKAPCDACEIRESTKIHDAGTSTDHECFTSTVHTQVVEQDLISSKAVFNPTGGAPDSTPISIAHMTPAQLVSQLAARAKTLKGDSGPPQQHPPANQFSRRNPSYDYDGRTSQYQNYNNYRY